jgi:Flp pilus assembly pilin Flp
MGIARRVRSVDIETMSKLYDFLTSDDGQTMAEYSTVLTVITLACLTAFLMLAGGAQAAYERVAGLLGG